MKPFTALKGYGFSNSVSNLNLGFVLKLSGGLYSITGQILISLLSIPVSNKSMIDDSFDDLNVLLKSFKLSVLYLLIAARTNVSSSGPDFSVFFLL